MNLPDAAGELLDRALSVYRDSHRAGGFLRTHLDHLRGPLRLAIVGEAGSGRSTLLGAIVGDRIAAERLVVDWPGAVELIDAGTADADATLVLTTRPGSEPPALRPDHPIARATPVSTIVVLSRADELGGGRIDALISARQVARRHAKSPELGGLCQDVVAVAGLLAVGASTLTAEEFAVLDLLGREPRDQAEATLLSVDRFTAPGGRIAPAVRADLVARLGMFGVRIAITLVRRGCRDRDGLAAELVRASGILDLRTAIGANFVDRAPVLRARSALMALDMVLRMEPRPDAASIAADLERLLAGAHDFRELRLLAALRTGRVSFGEAAEEAVCLLGEHGTDPGTRLSLSGDAYDALLRWRAHAEDARLADRERRAATVVARSCEALISAFAR
ncbi:Isoniazid inductible protein IniC [Alloactinosynnema sp. L-07]|uniref:hypothetical protein n=1 Tax=Alloactinosynnema sp. L-07 TaxID=1653480 RepID=UPI00065EF733|nr:hypothetical protein [Alloactinosynnema sp. L-07]CRK59516.1 Isoniazid inductible protein IniC [Alloactinosynnema sp. L-07]